MIDDNEQKSLLLNVDARTQPNQGRLISGNYKTVELNTGDRSVHMPGSQGLDQTCKP